MATIQERYIIFFYAHYYPYGGMNDVLGYCEDLDAAKKLLIQAILKLPEYDRENWYRNYSCDVLDLETRQTIDEGFDNIPLSKLENAIPSATYQTACTELAKQGQ